MTDFPLTGVTRFLKRVVPFNTLDPAALQDVIKATEVAFYPAGTHIIRMGQPAGEFLFVIQTGCARVSIQDESGESILVDVRGEGDSFGAVSLLKGGHALFDVTAEEDLIVFLIPKDTVTALFNSNREFKRFFGFSLARNFKAVRQTADDQLNLLTTENQLHVDLHLSGAKTRDLMTRDILTCAIETSVRSAAGLMSRRGVGAILIIDPDGAPAGILTDADLRSKVIAQGLDLNVPVHQVMSTPVRTISPDAYTFDSLLDMSRYGVRHLVVTENGRAVGILSEHDFQLAIGSSPIGMIGDIAAAATIAELVAKRGHIDRVLEMAMHRSGAVKPMVALIAELTDRIVRQFIHVIEKEMVSQGHGAAPAAYCWLAMGSEGRREQTLCTDQDNALLYADVSADRAPHVKAWFLEFARQVVDALERFGIPRCQGGIMASNPQWCLSLNDWRRLFTEWIQNPTPERLRMATIFFDFRPVTTESDLGDQLGSALIRQAAGKRYFSRMMAQNALINRPPLGFLRQFVVEKSGAHNSGLNLKLRGLTPVVDVARVLALELGVSATNTIERLRAATEHRVLRRDFYAAVDDAYDYINYIRIDHHLKAVREGRPMTNFVDPAMLNPMERKVLKESFTVISQLQELLAAHCRL